ncbi:STAS domain-containing protein [Lolliginicoccus suaedae]|uniref:STAS domain-containing protein n=1 Tax=Lolliginicoccus suaedae TaxID=2605429 RepID=UPI0011F03E14|nr:STAS domain-containing protein [Lolliginicoccus suaedae]
MTSSTQSKRFRTVARAPGRAPTLIAFTGDVDARRISDPEAWAARHAPGICPAHCIVDLTRATFLGASGIAAISALADALRDRGGCCVVVAGGSLRHILSATRADQQIAVVGTIREAQQSIMRFVETGRLDALLDADAQPGICHARQSQ